MMPYAVLWMVAMKALLILPKVERDRILLEVAEAVAERPA